MEILKAIGNTSLVRLRAVFPKGCADVFVKLEWENPTGSVKDRMAQAVISRAESDGRLKPGDTVIEYTGGSTGASLALICAAKGYRIRSVTSDAFSREKLDHMAALGAELTIVPSEEGRTTKKLILDMIETARKLSAEPNTYWTDQLHNLDTIAGYYSLGEEIWRQTEGDIDAFVHCVGTAASSRGVATVLKRYEPTNNAAERALRRAVLWRKTSYGSQSGKGLRVTERLLSVTETARQNAIDLLDYLAQAITARRQNTPAPPLLPAT